MAVGLTSQGVAEANTSCDISVTDSATSMVEVFGIPVRYGPAPTVVTGTAPRGVRAVHLTGPGGQRTLELSAHRGFLALYAAGARGRVSLVSELQNGSRTVRSFRLPLARERSRRPHHSHRRAGAVFNDEIGEDITELTYRQTVRRYGQPAVLRRVRGSQCAYYELVGVAGDGWRFCFGGDGRMKSASGNSSPPRR